jgi:hypothetical protein
LALEQVESLALAHIAARQAAAAREMCRPAGRTAAQARVVARMAGQAGTLAQAAVVGMLAQPEVAQKIRAVGPWLAAREMRLAAR